MFFSLLLLRSLLSIRSSHCCYILQRAKFLKEITRLKIKRKSTALQDFRQLILPLFSPELGLTTATNPVPPL